MRRMRWGGAWGLGIAVGLAATAGCGSKSAAPPVDGSSVLLDGSSDGGEGGEPADASTEDDARIDDADAAAPDAPQDAGLDVVSHDGSPQDALGALIWSDASAAIDV